MRLPIRAALLVGLVVLLALASLSWGIVNVSHPSPDDLILFFVFAVLAILAEVYATWIPAYKWEISSSIAIYLAGLFILGPDLVLPLVFASSAVSELLLRWGTHRKAFSNALVPIAFNVSQSVVAVAAAGALMRVLERESLLMREPAEFALAVAAFLAYFLLNVSLVVGIISVTQRRPFWHLLAENLHAFVVQYAVLCVSAILLAVLRSLSVWHVFLALFPLTLVHISFRSYLKLQTQARNTFERISELLDARDHYTAVHSAEVAELALAIGRELGMSERDLEQVDIAARVHDIGKVAIPDAILLKPGPLNDAEWGVMKTHPVISAQLVEGLEIYSNVADAVRHEHERWDGSGYPDGLRGEAIPLLSRVIAAADIYNALSTDRPYRRAFSREDAMRIVAEMRGVDIDPRVADALLAVISRAQTPETIAAAPADSGA
ncbi:MAG: HD-GYP domain-containing protein [Candidatus Bipolaricaulota bacterium]